MNLNTLEAIRTGRHGQISGAEIPKPRDLAIRIITATLLVSTLLSLVATAIQLLVIYDRDRSAVLSSFDRIQSSFSSGIENALWEFNSKQVGILLDGIESTPDIGYVRLAATTGRTWTRGEVELSGTVVRLFELDYSNPGGTVSPVGQLEIGLSMDSVKSRLAAQFWTLVLTNFAKTMMVALAMIAILQWYVFRHIRTISDYVRQSDWLAGDSSLRLLRSAETGGDDLDEIASAINFAQSRVRLSYEDITEEVRQRKLSQDLLLQKANELEDANLELLQSNREQAEFSYAISHDLKSPATTLAMVLDEIMFESDEVLGEESRQLMLQAQLTVTRMRQQIDSVLNYSSSITKTADLEEVVLSQIIQVALDNIQGELKQNNANVHIDTPHHVSGDAALLLMLFFNLLSNAVKYQTPGQSAEIKIVSELDYDSDTVTVSVIDNGIGIDEKHHAQIFGLFKRLNLSSEYEGSGIGLSLCQRIARKHGAEIQVSSSLGSGSTFQVMLRNWSTG